MYTILYYILHINIYAFSPFLILIFTPIFIHSKDIK